MEGSVIPIEQINIYRYLQIFIDIDRSFIDINDYRLNDDLATQIKRGIYRYS